MRSVVMANRDAKDSLFAAFASVAKALGNGHRAEIGQSVANTSQHLRVLAQAGLVQSRRAGTRVIYRPASEGVLDLWTAVRGVAAEHVASVEVLADAYLGDRSEVESVTMADLAARLAEGSVVLLDVRPSAEYRAGHLP